MTLVATVLSGMTLRPPPPLRYLVTLVATVPAELEGGWLKTYSSELGADVVDYGGGATGSPAVPGSSRLLHREGDSALYTVTVLRGDKSKGETYVLNSVLLHRDSSEQRGANTGVWEVERLFNAWDGAGGGDSRRA